MKLNPENIGKELGKITKLMIRQTKKAAEATKTATKATKTAYKAFLEEVKKPE